MDTNFLNWNNLVFIIGGGSWHPSLPPTAAVRLFDPLMGTWRDATSLPVPLGAMACGIVGDTLILSVRNLGYSRNAGEFVKKYFLDLGSAGGHRSMAKAVVPIRAPSEPRKESTLPNSCVPPGMARSSKSERA